MEGGNDKIREVLPQWMDKDTNGHRGSLYAVRALCIGVILQTYAPI